MADHLPKATWNGEEYVGIPEDLRCKRSDGKQWRCSAMSMPDKTVCEKHYIQAKKRAANSALRASMKKAKRKSFSESERFLESKCDDYDVPTVTDTLGDYSGSGSGKKYKDKLQTNYLRHSPDTPSARSLSTQKSSKVNDELQTDAAELEENWRSYRTPSSTAMDSSKNKVQMSADDNTLADYSGGDTYSSEETDGHICHQCRRNDRGNVLWCLKCDRRGYCNSCISTWYSDIPLEDIERVCPACRGTCNCKVCLRGDNMIKVRIREIPVEDKLQYLHCLLASVLPIVKHIHYEQCSEVELEKKLCGTVTDLVRWKLNADEQMCCDFCRMPIIDYHRHCANCSYDLCLSCCQDLREASSHSMKGESVEKGNGGGSQDAQIVAEQVKTSKLKLCFSEKFPDWNANTDGSIPCPPKRYGGCGCLSLTLRRIFKMNWVAKLAKNVEEMVSGCKIYDEANPEKTLLSNSRLRQFAQREDSDDNCLYCPASQDIKIEGIGDFRKHWVRGQPVIVQLEFDALSVSSWNPMAIWSGIRETADEKMKDENRTVKAINCLGWREVDVELNQFIKGYSEGPVHENSWPELLKLKDWPSPSASEEFLLYQKPEFISRLPLLEYIHSKWGFLNVAARLPHYSLQNDVGPKILISYGNYEELGKGDSVSKLHFNVRDMVYLLMHTTELQKTKAEKIQKMCEDLAAKDSDVDLKMNVEERIPDSLTSRESTCVTDFDMNKAGEQEDEGNQTTPTVEEKIMNIEQSNGDCKHASVTACPGTLWDVFRRKDVPRLCEYLRVHREEIGQLVNVTNDSLARPLYDESIYLNSEHKRKLKEEFGVEPWSFEQHLGQAVFIPAGCPFQLRNLQSTVQVSMDFLSPESIGEAARLAPEIRCLPNEHDAKLQVLEVGKMSLYAASSAIKDVQKLVLDTKFSTELGFEDPNLTALVSENLEKMVKRRQIACA